MSKTLSEHSVNLTHNQRARVAKGHGLFKRQYLCLLTNTRNDSISQAWDDVKRAIRSMKSSGAMSEDEGRALMQAGRELLDDHVQVLALELMRYELLTDYLKRVNG